MKIADPHAITIAFPLRAPLRHGLRSALGRFVRTVMEMETGDGAIELAEVGSGGESAEK
jgi:glucarate dehydratase